MKNSHLFVFLVISFSSMTLCSQTVNITWTVPSGTLRFSYLPIPSLGLNGFEGALGYESPRNFFNGTGNVVSPSECKTVLLKLATVNFTGDYDPSFNPTDANVSYGYRFMRNATSPPAKPEFAPYIINTSAGYSFQEFSQNIPLSAWDVTNPSSPQRLALGFLENNTLNGLVDGKYWPGSDLLFDNYQSSGPREWLFIFDEPYTTSVNTTYTQDIFAATAPHRVMYWAAWNRIDHTVFSPTDSPEDQFLITPTVVTGVNYENDLLENFSLYQNYPNPFNPETTIEFSLPTTQRVVLKIFDLLGREVLNVTDKEYTVGRHKIRFNGNNLTSGVYFYRIIVGNYSDTKKLVLLR